MTCRLDHAADGAVVVVVIVAMLVDVATTVLPTSADLCVLSDTGVNHSGVLNPVGNLTHRSAVVASAVLVSPVVVRQRDRRLRFRLSDTTGTGSTTTLTRTSVFPQQRQRVQLGARKTSAQITRRCRSFR